ncbi:hypothetical protein P255_01007 [Acinetobacter brisouii CIP 110357]|uniref:Prepilin-type N-terminal cleavage/methylation domain-containing protein n=1 Tax=Acinetobacter brisouii CIP 110357 TaxID=1341683 RepID=V2UPL3_9GAMM|nr:pilin [Acinetobacter brisouii]ENV48128.1 hypothetical protein F954_01195 [Acinetobacter brisouii ANC 4119]ESK51912.1 hypothetical protein P255_01007 [Acinetobacter brisouii CIP 110357]
MGKHIKGFSLVEMLIIVAIISILASFAVLTYQIYVAKAEVADALIEADGLRPIVTLNIASNNSCGDESSVGTYGTAVVSGTAPNCIITYTFNQTKAISALKLKVIGFNVGLNGSFTINADTTVDSLYLPSSFQ